MFGIRKESNDVHSTFLLQKEGISPFSKVFEGKGLMIYEVKPSIEKTIEELDNLITCESINDDITTHFRRFHFTQNNLMDNSTSNENVLAPFFNSPGDKKRKLANRRETTVDMSYLKHLNNQSIEQAITTKKERKTLR